MGRAGAASTPYKARWRRLGRAARAGGSWKGAGVQLRERFSSKGKRFAKSGLAQKAASMPDIYEYVHVTDKRFKLRDAKSVS